LGTCHIHIFEGSLEVKLPTIWTDEKQSREEAERRERLEERRVEEKEYKKNFTQPWRFAQPGSLELVPIYGHSIWAKGWKVDRVENL